MRRPIIDKGEAYKIVYLNKAPQSMKDEELSKAVDYHERQMRIELQKAGKHVVRVARTHSDGNAHLTAWWVVLGNKNTKHERRLRAKLQRNAPANFHEEKPRHLAASQGVQEGGDSVQFPGDTKDGYPAL